MSSDYDYGPLQTYEIIYRSGYVETVQAHQVQLPHDGFFGKPDPFVTIHGEFDGHWRLVMRVPGEDILSIRLVPAAAGATP